MSVAQAQELFNNIPRNDVLGFFKNGEPQYKRPVEFLRFKKDDVAVATNTPKSSIRYDQKMPEELKERLTEWATAINLVASYFEDTDKTMLWFQVPNPLLGNVSPRDMIRLGRFKKLYKFIVSALDENRR